MPSATGQSSSISEASGSVTEGRPVGTWPTVSTPSAGSPNSVTPATAAATTSSGAGARGTKRSNATSAPIVRPPTAIVISEACGRPCTIAARLWKNPPFVKCMPSSLGSWSVTITSAMPALNPIRTGSEMKLARKPSRRIDASTRMPPTSRPRVAVAVMSAAASPPGTARSSAVETRIASVVVVLTLSGLDVPSIA